MMKQYLHSLTLTPVFLLLMIPQISGAAGEVSITSFEGPEEGFQLVSENAFIRKTAGLGVTDGNQALEIIFEKDASWTGIRMTADESWDCSELGGSYHLRIDAHNPGPRTVNLTAFVGSEDGQSQRRSVAIPAGSSGSYYFELMRPGLTADTGLRDDPDPFEIDATRMISDTNRGDIDYTKVKSIVLGTRNIIFDKTLVIDNLRIVRSPQADPNSLVGIVDAFGQNAKMEFATKIHSEEELKAKADEELRQLAVSLPMSDRGRFGGYKDGPQLEATGYFRTTKIGGQWALVDPDGYLFFSSGIANVRMANTSTYTGIDYRDSSVRKRDDDEVTPEDSIGIVHVSPEVRQTAFVAAEWRRQMFTERPPYDSELPDNYSYRRSSHIGPIEHGETFSFYQANLERRYGEPSPGFHLLKWRDITLDRMLDWGFTSFGNWAAPEFYHSKRFPYFANGWIIGDFQKLRSGADYWGPIADPFDPEFARRAELTVQVVAVEVLNSPWCMGVFIHNEISWGSERSFRLHYGIVMDALSRDAASSPAKRAFVDILSEVYPSIGELNAAWETDYSSWNDFGREANLYDHSHPQAMAEDFSMLKEALATQYFKVVHDALEAVLPNQLYMGARFAKWGMSDEVLRGAKNYVDVMSFNSYTEGVGGESWAFLEDLDLPCIIGEYHFGSRDSGLFTPGLIHAVDQADRARMYREYMDSVLENPYMVGAHWFQYTDSPLTGRAHDGENYNVGFVSITDIPYPEMVEAAKAFNKDLYQRRFGSLIGGY